MQSIHNTNELYIFNFAELEWNVIPKPKTCITFGKNFNYPPSIDSHRACLQEDSGMLYVMGGYIGDEFGKFTNQVFRYDIKGNNWIELLWKAIDGKGPSPRSDHAMILNDKYLYIFGGTDENVRFGDLWSFEIETATWREIYVTSLKPSVNKKHRILRN